MSDAPLSYSFIKSPIGRLLLVSDGAALCGLYMELHKGGPLPVDQWRLDDALLNPVRDQLDAYFAGELPRFDARLSLMGTEFQLRVWNALCEIPLGRTVTYAHVARQIGAPKAVRAVGAAVGSNPVSILVPCHRVVGSDGSLTGFGGGLDRKRWLLAHERRFATGGGEFAQLRQAEFLPV